MQDLYSVHRCQSSVSFLIEMSYIMLMSVFFTHINISTEANMKDVYDFVLLVDMTSFFFFLLYQ